MTEFFTSTSVSNLLELPMFCDRQVDECWVAVRDGLIKAVERFFEPTCCPIQNGAKECHLQQDVEVQLRVRDLIHPESLQSPARRPCCTISANLSKSLRTLHGRSRNVH